MTEIGTMLFARPAFGALVSFSLSLSLTRSLKFMYIDTRRLYVPARRVRLCILSSISCCSFPFCTLNYIDICVCVCACTLCWYWAKFELCASAIFIHPRIRLYVSCVCIHIYVDMCRYIDIRESTHRCSGRWFEPCNGTEPRTPCVYDAAFLSLSLLLCRSWHRI